MSESEAGPRMIQGRQLRCPVCKGGQFERHRYLLNTRAATFFNFDWANRGADAYVCAGCGHILWFRNRPDSGS